MAVASTTKLSKAGVQLRRAISIHAEGKSLLKNLAIGRLLQGFVRRANGKDISSQI
jgi:hypothetical protein